MRIALDAMGGDHAPGEIVKGAVAASREYDINVVLVGKRKLIQAELAKHSPKGFILPIVDAEEVVSMHDPAAFSVRYKKESSIVVGINMVKTGQVSAFVSAGSTGAVTAASILMLGRVKGIDRPAISTVLPFTAGPLLLLDVGANPNCKPNYLVQFAQMGSVYMERVFGIDNPRVGLLNIGEEETKGNQITQEAHQLLKNSDVNFIGNIESRQLTSGMMDILVTDGFTGNIMLKMGEGLGDMFIGSIKKAAKRNFMIRTACTILHPTVKSIYNQLDYREYGGACLLGVKGNIVIAHGRSDFGAIKNAIYAAKIMIENNFVQAMSNFVSTNEAEEMSKEKLAVKAEEDI